MTEGTSQGLFVVVAIVIFGIFVGLSYTLFGDTLKPAMVVLFESAFKGEEPKIPETDATLFTYEENASGLTITGYTGTAMDISIPSKIDGKSVTIIGDRAFLAKGLTSVTIPNSVTTIDTWSFGENSLTSIIIPNSVNIIGDSAFMHNLLTSVAIGNSVTTIKRQAFLDNKLTSLTIPDSVTSIGILAFLDNTELKTVELPYGYLQPTNGAVFQVGVIFTNRTL